MRSSDCAAPGRETTASRTSGSAGGGVSAASRSIGSVDGGGSPRAEHRRGFVEQLVFRPIADHDQGRARRREHRGVQRPRGVDGHRVQRRFGAERQVPVGMAMP